MNGGNGNDFVREHKRDNDADKSANKIHTVIVAETSPQRVQTDNNSDIHAIEANNDANSVDNSPDNNVDNDTFYDADIKRVTKHPAEKRRD